MVILWVLSDGDYGIGVEIGRVRDGKYFIGARGTVWDETVRGLTRGSSNANRLRIFRARD